MENVKEALDQVKAGLTAFKGFLGNMPAGAVQEAATRIPVIRTVIEKLIDLIGALDAKLTELDPNNALAQVPGFFGAVSEMLAAAHDFIQAPSDLQEAMADAAGIAEVLEEVRALIPLTRTALQTLLPA
jgi:hypothetical protein